jgi:predicted Abi (CAAX) family protease
MTEATRKPVPRTQKRGSYSNYISLLYLLFILYTILSADLFSRNAPETTMCVLLTGVLGLVTLGLILKEITFKNASRERRTQLP